MCSADSGDRREPSEVVQGPGWLGLLGLGWGGLQHGSRQEGTRWRAPPAGRRALTSPRSRSPLGWTQPPHGLHPCCGHPTCCTERRSPGAACHGVYGKRGRRWA